MEQLQLIQNFINIRHKEKETTFQIGSLSKYTPLEYQQRIQSTRPVKGKSKNRRNEQFEAILSLINDGRVSSGYKEVTAGRLAKLLKTANIIDLDVFIGSMKDAKNPAKFFWWKIKQN